MKPRLQSGSASVAVDCLIVGIPIEENRMKKLMMRRGMLAAVGAAGLAILTVGMLPAAGEKAGAVHV